MDAVSARNAEQVLREAMAVRVMGYKSMQYKEMGKYNKFHFEFVHFA
jgi:hypothetical protein